MARASQQAGREIQQIAIDDLLLDEDNPRLPASIHRTTQAIIDYIAETTAIEELMSAIAENDFFPGEPLIAVECENHPDKFTVVEGNRRLTALKLLQDPAFCSKPGARMREISSSAKFKPSVVPVIVCTSREEVLPYLGFRHITGIKQWEPLSKARYIEQLFNLTNGAFPAKERYSEVSRTIGSRRDHIKRNLDALAVYRVIENNNFYEIDDLNEETIKFAVLSTAIADDKIGNFIGINVKDTDGNIQISDPIVDGSVLKKNEISELTRWLYEKSEKGKTRVGESRNLRELAAVVDNPRALEAFRRGSPLKIAYQQTGNLINDFIELLYRADASLTEAASIVATIDYDDDAYSVAKRILENIKLIGRELKEKRSSNEDGF
ncbi:MULTISPECIES: ParB N-terminal domain-containing protein [Methylomonas]|uniref:Chromosome partitioning protein ParB n=1 Tax=Methylomonas koyamae TaxID=702114 RepID=A0A177N0C3_9GAMM|nr:ParB N-terminal domain-containing protein [Methylomonas koyamae]OAI11417.1 chromosome partitioning protein ParB [Methylomonas koyamae]